MLYGHQLTMLIAAQVTDVLTVQSSTSYYHRHSLCPSITLWSVSPSCCGYARAKILPCQESM